MWMYKEEENIVKVKKKKNSLNELKDLLKKAPHWVQYVTFIFLD